MLAVGSCKRAAGRGGGRRRWGDRNATGVGQSSTRSSVQPRRVLGPRDKRTTAQCSGACTRSVQVDAR